MARASTLTVCSYTTPAHSQVLSWNLSFSEALNEAPPSWIVTELSQFHTDDPRYRSGAGNDFEPSLKPDLDPKAFPNVRWLAAPTKKDIAAYAGRRSLEADENFRYEVALSLENAIRHVKTRYAVILDPRFFLVRENWSKTIPAYLAEKKLQAFGAPWHPRWFQKWRNFPGLECLFLDLEKLELEPGFLKPKSTKGLSKGSPFWTSLILTPGRIRRYATFARHWKAALSEDQAQRSEIGSWKGLGYPLYERRESLAFESVIPVFEPKRDGFLPPSACPLQMGALSEKLFPSEKGYLDEARFTTVSFGQLGLPDLRDRGWEEYFWRGNPFGFQVRAEEHWSRKGTFADKHLGRALDAILLQAGKSSIKEWQEKIETRKSQTVASGRRASRAPELSAEAPR